MAEVKVLIEGYANKKEASSSTVLVIADGEKIVVDPGTNKPRLIQELSNEGLTSEDIDFVILTHMHFDHAALVGLFTNAMILDNNSTYDLQGRFWDNQIVIKNVDIEILSTPGHDQFHCSVLATDQVGKKVAVAGDVFWTWDSEDAGDLDTRVSRKDPYEKNSGSLLESRKILLGLADFIIPGHGKMFGVKR